MNELTHLALFERTLLSGAEWSLDGPAWVVARLEEGIVYAQADGAHQDVPLGGVIVKPADGRMSLLASVLGRAVVRGLAVRIPYLSGLLTPAECHHLEARVAREFRPYRLLPADHPLALLVARFQPAEALPPVRERLAFLQTLVELLGPELTALPAAAVVGAGEVKARLRRFLERHSACELAELSLADVATHLRCSPRHASRLFHETFGSSFRAYSLEARLKKACQLLTTTRSKVLDVALQSGHGSLAGFNFLFKKRFGITPSVWRARHAAAPSVQAVRSRAAAVARAPRVRL